MQNITVTRYPNPGAVGWAGYIEPEDKGWIAFIGRDGRPVFFLNRDPMTGAILSDNPAEHEANLRELRETGGFRTGMRVPDDFEDPKGAHGYCDKIRGLRVPVVGEGPIG